MRKFFVENNPYALEGISRRLLEASPAGAIKNPAGGRGLDGGARRRRGVLGLYTEEIEGFGEKMKAAMGKLQK